MQDIFSVVNAVKSYTFIEERALSRRATFSNAEAIKQKEVSIVLHTISKKELSTKSF